MTSAHDRIRARQYNRLIASIALAIVLAGASVLMDVLGARSGDSSQAGRFAAQITTGSR